MKIAIIGSRNIANIDIENYIPPNASFIISGGARGIDTLAEKYAEKNYIPKLILKPNYKKYGKSAPLVRNKVVKNSDVMVAIRDGFSRGTKFTIDYAKKLNKETTVYIIS